MVKKESLGLEKEVFARFEARLEAKFEKEDKVTCETLKLTSLWENWSKFNPGYDIAAGPFT